MKRHCPYCTTQSCSSEFNSKTIRQGRFYRKSDSQWILRFKCLRCKKTFSRATFHPCFRQHKRHKNLALKKLICSAVSQRRAARILSINRKTVARKLIFLSQISQKKFKTDLDQIKIPFQVIEFDDLETFEHTKCKPLSVTLAVESRTRIILGFRVAVMPAKGRLVHKALKKYGPRKDQRTLARQELFKELAPRLFPYATVKSDSNPHYVSDVQKYFPKAFHERHIGQRGSTTGQGELKRIRFDPLFSLNHTCAMLRADICRLVRKTWCTTKKKERLTDHLHVYVNFHNEKLGIKTAVMGV